MIEVKNVSKKYKEKVALSGCNIQIPRGQIIGPVSYTHLDVYKRQMS